jgi:hypothetical protein
VPKTARRLDWSAFGKIYNVSKKRVQYLKPKASQIQKEEWFPKLSIQKSTISGAGNGLYAEQRILEGQKITMYGGVIRAVCDADKLRDAVIYVHNFRCLQT